MPIFELSIPTIICNNCARPIQTALKECEEVESVSVNIIKKIATVKTQSGSTKSDAEILKQLRDKTEEIGFSVTEVGISTYSYWIKGILGVIAGLAVLGICIWGTGIPLLGLFLMGGISSLLTLYIGKDTYKHAIINLVKTKTLSMESLFTVSTLLALGISCASFFVPWLPMMFDAALLILGFKNIGQAIQESAKQKIIKKSFRSLAPKKIQFQESFNSTKRIDADVSVLVPTNVIIVYKGQTVPVDGKCLEDNTSIYNTIFTGRTLPQHIKKNDFICAGSVVPDDVEFIRIEVTATEENSYLAMSDRSIDQAELEKAPIETSATKILQYFIPIVFVIAVASAITIATLLSPLAAIQCGIAVLVSACPCILGLITPLAVRTGIAKAAALGVTFKSGKAIQTAAEIDTVVFDLNGTLTTGVPVVTKTTLSPEMLSILANIEAESNHPIAKAIYHYAIKERRITKNDEKFTRHNFHHSGMIASTEHDQFIVGNSNMMQDQKIDFSEFIHDLTHIDAEHIIYFAKNNKIMGYILLEDPLRPDAIATIQALRQQNKAIHLCTGADRHLANKYAAKLGIDLGNIRANQIGGSEDPSANTKKKYIKELIDAGRHVTMVGDAGNDAAAVAASHFGIAIQSDASSPITQEQASAKINHNSLWSVVNAFTVAQQTFSNIKQNLVISISYNILAMVAFSGLLVAVGFALNPALGALLMIVQTGIILLNVKRFERQAVPTITATQMNHPNQHPTEFNSTHERLHQRFSQQPKQQMQPSLDHPAALKHDLSSSTLLRSPKIQKTWLVSHLSPKGAEAPNLAGTQAILPNTRPLHQAGTNP